MLIWKSLRRFIRMNTESVAAMAARAGPLLLGLAPGKFHSLRHTGSQKLQDQQVQTVSEAVTVSFAAFVSIPA